MNVPLDRANRKGSSTSVLKISWGTNFHADAQQVSHSTCLGTMAFKPFEYDPCKEIYFISSPGTLIHKHTHSHIAQGATHWDIEIFFYSLLLYFILIKNLGMMTS